MQVRNKKTFVVGLSMIGLGLSAGALGFIVDFALLVFFGLVVVGLSFIE